MGPTDAVILVLLLLAALRGLAVGLVREAFSLAAIGGACIAVRLFTAPASGWVAEATGLGDSAARVVAAAALAVGTLLVVGLLGRGVRRGLRAAGLGAWDRLGGAVLGTAEGAVVAAILLVLATFVLGRDHPLVAGSRSLEAFERLESFAAAPPASAPPDVAAPPRP